MRLQKNIKNNAVPLLICFLWVLCGPVSGWSQGSDATDEGLEITGLILDETKTKPGRDFYEYFSTFWQEVKGLQYTITISELPDATRGTFVSLTVNDTLVYRRRLNPQPEVIEQEARRAVSAAKIYMYKQLTAEKQLEEEFQY